MPQIPAYIRTTSMVFCITIMVLGVIGNIMVPIVIMKTKDMRNSTNIFLTNLSIADLLVLLVCTPTVLVEVNTRPETWVLGQEMCKAVPFVELTVAHASVLTILAISFERYYAICEPLKAGYVCTKTRALLICLIAWAVAALFTSPILLVAEYKFVRYFDGSQVPVCLTQASGPWTMGFFLMTISLFFVIPFIILVVLYGIIARDLISKDGAMMKIRPTKYELSFKARKQVVLMLGAVVLAFFLCLLPFRIFTLWVILSPAEFEVDMERYYNMLCFCRIMLYLNSAINPVLYNLMSSKFRKGFLKLCILCDPLKRSLKVRPRTATINTTTTSSSILSRSSNRRTSERTTCSTEKIEPKLISVPDCEMGLLRQQTMCTDDFPSLPLGNGNRNRSPHSSMESVNIEGVEVDQQSVKVPNYRVKCQRHISFDDTLVINKPKQRERVMFQQSLDERKIIMKSAKNGVPESNGGY